jgi:hypothetical protein
MTVAAVDAESRYVMLMAEWHRLLALDSLIGGVRRPHHAADHPQHESHGKDSAEDRDAGESIGAAVENLSHLQAATVQDFGVVKQKGGEQRATADGASARNGGDHIQKMR